MFISDSGSSQSLRPETGSCEPGPSMPVSLWACSCALPACAASAACSERASVLRLAAAASLPRYNRHRLTGDAWRKLHLDRGKNSVTSSCSWLATVSPNGLTSRKRYSGSVGGVFGAHNSKPRSCFSKRHPLRGECAWSMNSSYRFCPSRIRLLVVTMMIQTPNGGIKSSEISEICNPSAIELRTIR